MTRVIFDFGIETEELRRDVEGVEDCERTSMEKPDGKFGKKFFVKENLKRESSSCVSGSTLYKKDTLDVTREQMF